MSLTNPVVKDFYRGNTVPYQLVFTDKETGGPLDITGWGIIWTFKRELSDTIPIFQQTGILTDPVNGVVDFKMTGVQTLLFEAGVDYFYDFKTIVTGESTTIINGSVCVQEPVNE